MLELRGITKSYTTASLTQVALDGVNLSFRDNEFVAILGQSGSGKTTMLNVIGGLDSFDSGDLLIDGISTKDYKARDWDTYRNNRIGFVFQSYNLISHQSVLANVELALTLSGVGRAERRARALDALREVGLSEHVHKKPGQLSGGQMQRVAIARALVNDPEILLADEPTGALDSTTSVQVMDLLKQVAAERLVIMVTHNPDLARTYATRIVELADGRVVGDSAPFAYEEDTHREREVQRSSMGFFTALSLSASNLMTKKGRTAMTSFAGSIGIIGIAAILALANGINAYIARTEEEMLTSYPMSIERSGVDFAALFALGVSGGNNTSEDAQEFDKVEDGRVHVNPGLENVLETVSTNDLVSFKTFLESGGSGIKEHVRAVEYSYDISPRIFLPDRGDGALQVNPSLLASEKYLPKDISPSFRARLQTDSFYQLPASAAVYEDSYKVKAGRWPKSADEIVVVLDENGRLIDVFEINMGLRDISTIAAIDVDKEGEDSSQSSQSGGEGAKVSNSSGERSYSYEDLLDVEFRLVHAHDMYTFNTEKKIWTDRSEDQEHIDALVKKGQTLRVVGVVQGSEETKAHALQPGLYYTPELVKQIVREASTSQIVREQAAHPERNVFTGKKFDEEKSSSSFEVQSIFKIDEEKIRAAFSFDESALAGSIAELDLTGIDLSALDAASFDMGAMDLSDLDFSSLGDINIEDIGVNDIDLSSLRAQFPQLSAVRWDEVLAKSFAGGVLRPEGAQLIGATTQEILAGFVDYQTKSISSGKDIATLAGEYFSRPEVIGKLRATLADPRVINQDKLADNLARALGEDPALSTIAQEVGSEISSQIATALASRLGAQVSSVIGEAISTQLQTAMSAYMTQMMEALQTQIQAQIEKTFSSIGENMSEALKIDEKSLKEAFGTNMDAKDIASYMASMFKMSTQSYESNMRTLGWADWEDPAAIKIYPSSFVGKEAVKEIIESYNSQMESTGREDKAVTYTDFVGTLMTSVTQIINVISMMLIAFVAISLIVSSIMVGIITYISVLERRKEIGILRSIGASKRDVRSVFNAETFLIGLLSGVIGVGVATALTIPTNVIVEQNYGVAGIAHLSVLAALSLIGISIFLTLVAGLIPAAAAAKADPVEALRSE